MVEAIIKRVLDTVRSNRNVDLISVSGDYGARFICAVLAVDGVPIKVAASCAVTINAKRADGQSKAFEGSVNEDGTVKVPITQWMLEIAHTRTECTVSAVGIDTKLSATPFDIEVAETPHQSEEISPDDPDYDVLVQVLAGEASRNAAEAARVKAEEARALAEKERASAETERDRAATVREQAEALRAAAENQREQAEASRNAAEAERVKAEDERASAFLAMDGRISRNEKRISIIESAVYGDLAQEVEDNAVAYIKDVPVSALPTVKVNKVGGMTRKCTNLIPYPYVNNGGTVNGIVWTVNSDGSITANGTATSNSIYVFRNYDVRLNKGTYTLSGIPADGSTSTFMLQGASKIHGAAVNNTSVNGNKLVLNNDVTDYTIQCVIFAGYTANNLVFKPMINEGPTALPYEPYFEGLRSAPVTEIVSVGANLIPYPYTETTKTINGITFTDNGDGSITVNGTATETVVFAVSKALKVQNGEHTIGKISEVTNTKEGVFAQLFYKKDDGSYFTQNVGNTPVTLSLSSTIAYSFQIAVTKGVTVSNVTVYPMLNKGETALPCAPYVSTALTIPEATQALDGYGEGVDESVYNYIDFEKKQFIKRLGKAVFDGSTDEIWLATPAHNNTDYNAFYTRMYAENAHKSVGGAAICDKLPNRTATEWYSNNVDGFYMGNVSDKQIMIRVPNSITNATALREWLAENPLTIYYELATPEVTDISDILSVDNYIEVEGGGSLTFENEYKYDVPSGVTFVTKEVSE